MTTNEIRVSAIAFLLCCAVCVAQQKTPPAKAPASPSPSSPASPSGSSQHDNFEVWGLTFSGLEATGTLLVAVLAVFGQRIRSWIIRPKIILSVGEAAPFVEKFEEEDASVAGGRRTVYHIRLEVINAGKEAARNCMILCNNVHKARAGGAGFYELKKFVPKQFFWTTKDQRLDVVPKIPSYVSIAEISEPSPSVAGGGVVTPATASICLQILVEAEGIKGRFFRVENGKTIIPVMLYADNLPRASKHYVEICWSGKSINEFSPSNFQICLLNEKQGNAIIGGAQ